VASARSVPSSWREDCRPEIEARCMRSKASAGSSGLRSTSAAMRSAGSSVSRSAVRNTVAPWSPLETLNVARSLSNSSCNCCLE
jgi:hypothetical protein